MRQFINRGDTLEIFRARAKFKPKYLPIMRDLSDADKGEVIQFAQQHRQLMHDQGRLNRCRPIEGVDDPMGDVTQYRYYYDKVADTYEAIMARYCPNDLERIKRDIIRTLRSRSINYTFQVFYRMGYSIEKKQIQGIMTDVNAANTLQEITQALKSESRYELSVDNTLVSCRKLHTPPTEKTSTLVSPHTNHSSMSQ